MKNLEIVRRIFDFITIFIDIKIDKIKQCRAYEICFLLGLFKIVFYRIGLKWLFGIEFNFYDFLKEK